ncbi:frataxin homolog, mitochondrial [Orussus abietinus]|uniref:frataxin homolog, mitochondrial n=1 Tax=Orussus abietinus TaxID=222816 RepID=UPI000626C14F|nr:frataxin homolog, mitochondrial [Orussus abietinus]
MFPVRGRIALSNKVPHNVLRYSIRRNLRWQVTVPCDTQVGGYVALCRAKYPNNVNTFRHITIAERDASSNITEASVTEISRIQFEKISDETLESLSEYFDELVEQANHLQDADVSYGDGVLTVKFGKQYGTYVINRQTPNRQIWLSSPKSGPKRYDFIDDKWIYKHDGKSLHALLDSEIPKIVQFQTTFNKCSYSGPKAT